MAAAPLPLAAAPETQAPAPATSAALLQTTTPAAMLVGGPLADGATVSAADTVGTSGSTALLANLVSSTYGVTGAGIKIGVLSDSFNDLGGAAADEADGALPSSGVTVLQDLTSNGTDEGRAMLELVHEIAPGAQLYFATAYDGESSFASNIDALKAAGCNIIIDDVQYNTEPWFQPGVIDEAIQTVTADGALYFTAAGNNASNAYESAWRGTGGDSYFNFNAGTGAAQTTQAVDVTLLPGDSVTFELQWAQPFNAPQTGFRLAVDTGAYGIYYDWGGLNYGGAAEAEVTLTDPYSYAISLSCNVSILKVAGSDPSMIKYAVLGDGLPVTFPGANTGTVLGHAEDPDAVTMAVEDSATGLIEPYSSSGAGTEWLYNYYGNPLGSPDDISKPNIAGVDGITTTVPDLSDFYGTSAGGPTAGAVAALLMQLAPAASAAEIEQAMESTATTRGDPSTVQGAGVVNALLAAQALVPTTALLQGQGLTVQAGQALQLTNLFSASVQIGTVSNFQIYEGSFDPTAIGTITNGGTALNSFQYYTVSSLAGITYTGGMVAGTDRLWVEADANGAWSSWTYVDFANVGEPPPVTSVVGSQEQTIGPNRSVALSSLFTTTQADGASITQYNIYEGSLGTPVGTVTNGGTTLTAFQYYTVTSLAGIDYNSSSTAAGTDRLWVQAYAAGQWGNWVYVDMNDTGAPAPTTSLLVAPEHSIDPNTTVALSSLFSATDSVGTITQYDIYEGSLGTPVGTITNGGATLNAFQYYTVSNLTGVDYNSSDTAAGTDRLWVQAYANGQWGNWVYVDMNNTGAPAPVASLVGSQEQTVVPGQQVALSSLFTASDASGASITQYDIYEGSFGTPVGTITNGGAPLNAFQYYTVSSLTGIDYNGGATAGTDRLWVQAYANGQWGNWVYVDMNNTGNTSTVAQSASAPTGDATQSQIAQFVQAASSFSGTETAPTASPLATTLEQPASSVLSASST